MPTSRKLLCAAYITIAIAALIATWSQNVAYFGSIAGFFKDFIVDTKVTAASRSITVDILLFGLAAMIFMVIEARKRGIRFVWAYIVGGMLVAISVTFPLFLVARELRAEPTDVGRVKAVDTILLALLAALTAAFVIYVDWL